MSQGGVWRRCSACKRDIPLGAQYWACNVSTCNRTRTALMFCTVTCWEVHLPEANHREAWAVEKRAPNTAEEPAAAAPGDAPARASRRRIVPSTASSASRDGVPREILIVANRLKDYVRARSGYNTSERVLGPLSDHVRRICDEAMQNAAREGRRTVLDRDIPDA